jgi:hypothetical protein
MKGFCYHVVRKTGDEKVFAATWLGKQVMKEFLLPCDWKTGDEKVFDTTWLGKQAMKQFFATTWLENR